MTIHMIRVAAAHPAEQNQAKNTMTLQEINSALDVWVGNHSQWAEDTASHAIVETETTGTGTPYYRGDYRFEFADAKADLLQKFEDKLQQKLAWYRAGYHECDHDESDRPGCSWDDRREWTAKDMSIPTDIPVFV